MIVTLEEELARQPQEHRANFELAIDDLYKIKDYGISVFLNDERVPRKYYLRSIWMSAYVLRDSPIESYIVKLFAASLGEFVKVCRRIIKLELAMEEIEELKELYVIAHEALVELLDWRSLAAEITTPME